MKGWIRGCAGLLAGSLCCGLASATMLEVNCTTIGPTQTELNGNLVCPQFNLAGQTLSSIAIDLTGEIVSDGPGQTTTLSLTNNSGRSQTATATTNVQFLVSSIAGLNAGPAPASGFDWSNPVLTASVSTGLVTLSAGETQTFDGLSNSKSAVLPLDTTQFAPYVGPGSFNVGITTLTGLTVIGGGGQIVAGQVTYADAKASVTYTYSPVPEPGTLSLIAVGVLALVALRRRAGK